ncbi:hypothetical protein ACFOG5_02235 [Pedobacter fastidiosus]|uniref:Uncharacterized protein n=1 Tax=Pedobacter fastidiosus TaxID=2765361 RepID=A0ABR7KXL8_9SPHI|nr:hypothetical protein [Pedobacter fastidiosus]MBC6112492.1 hypothetical protein [Pedobacter fastidiosus]
MSDLDISIDLQKFIDKFEPTKFKIMAHGIEIRGVKDIHHNVLRANGLIEKLKLSLAVNHNAEMLSYGGFEVNDIKIRH